VISLFIHIANQLANLAKTAGERRCMFRGSRLSS